MRRQDRPEVGAGRRQAAVVVLVLALNVAGAARAAAAEAERLDLATFIARALQTAPEIAEARSDVETMRAKLREAKAARFFPEASAISLTGAAPRARGTVLEPRDSVSTDALGPFTRIDVNLVQPLYTAGKVSAGIAAATHAVEQQIAAGEGRAAEVVEQVKTLYYNVLLARSVAGVVGEVRDAFTTALETARKRRDEGDSTINELDILHLRIGLAEIAKEVPKLESGGQIALGALRRLIGATASEAIDLSERFLEPAHAKLESLEHYAALLFERSPAWKQLEAGLAAKSEELKTVEADYYPSVFLSGVFSYSYAPRRDRQLNPFAYDDFNYLRGPGGVLGIRWLLNFHMTAARVATTRAELDKVSAQRRLAQSGLPLELEEVYRRAVQTRESVDGLTDGRKAGRALLTLAVTNFDVGVGEAKDILEGLGNYSRVTSDYYEAVRDHNLALAALTRVTGEEVMELPATAVPLPSPTP